MTMQLLEKILEENNIPSDVHFVSDSGWECGDTEMDGVYYNCQTNTIAFTPGGFPARNYDGSEDWEIIYAPDLIKMEGLEAYPFFSLMGDELEFELIALRKKGEIEQFYDVPESTDPYSAGCGYLDGRLLYSIKIKNIFIGYIRFEGDGNTLEPKMYIFKNFRNKGYGTKVLKKFTELAFSEGLYDEAKDARVFPAKLVSTAAAENEYAARMLKTCGFLANSDVAEITKEEYLKTAA
ncbi:MAG: GNAT family N-acetyltransferase [Lachnospiraceae bacterium]|nr:GNAT family N-acetyltransferase [Lachnospiraceae bacterium]